MKDFVPLVEKAGRANRFQDARRGLDSAENAAKNAIRDAEGKEPQPINLDDVKPDPKAQRNFTDPDSKIMKTSNKGWDRRGRMKRHGIQ